MREFRSSGSVRGVPSNGHPYRDMGWLPSSPHGIAICQNDVVVVHRTEKTATTPSCSDPNMPHDGNRVVDD